MHFCIVPIIAFKLGVLLRFLFCHPCFSAASSPIFIPAGSYASLPTILSGSLFCIAWNPSVLQALLHLVPLCTPPGRDESNSSIHSRSHFCIVPYCFSLGCDAARRTILSCCSAVTCPTLEFCRQFCIGSEPPFKQAVVDGVSGSSPACITAFRPTVLSGRLWCISSQLSFEQAILHRVPVSCF